MLLFDRSLADEELPRLAVMIGETFRPHALFGAVRGLSKAAEPANGVFARVPAGAIEQLEFGPGGDRNFWVWDAGERVVRLMCSWDTTEDDVREFAATLARIDVT